MPKPIQTQAAGLLGVLTSKDGGIGPAAADDLLQLGFRTNDFYGVNFRQAIFRGQTAAELDNAVTGWIGGGGALTLQGWFPTRHITDLNLPTDIQVPEGEIWRVLNVTAHFIRVTGTIDGVGVGWAHGMAPSFRFGCIFVGGSGNAGANEGITAGANCDFLATPGSCPAFFCPSWDLGVIDFDLNVYVTYERFTL